MMCFSRFSRLLVRIDIHHSPLCPSLALEILRGSCSDVSTYFISLSRRVISIALDASEENLLAFNCCTGQNQLGIFSHAVPSLFHSVGNGSLADLRSRRLCALLSISSRVGYLLLFGGDVDEGKGGVGPVK